MAKEIMKKWNEKLFENANDLESLVNFPKTEIDHVHFWFIFVSDLIKQVASMNIVIII